MYTVLGSTKITDNKLVISVTSNCNKLCLYNKVTALVSLQCNNNKLLLCYFYLSALCILANLAKTTGPFLRDGSAVIIQLMEKAPTSAMQQSSSGTLFSWYKTLCHCNGLLPTNKLFISDDFNITKKVICYFLQSNSNINK